ncbi:MAG: Biotin synthase [Syntrophorhabdaceae bacterium PtaU1.Bin034]|nr:MAG: Biotin synthase [Syntrophorhabdaceae bacterium PtaU1.Bin034]
MGKNTDEVLARLEHLGNPSKEDLIALIQSKGKDEDNVFECADRVRSRHMGDEVHLRGIIEFSNYCVKNCLYCGLRRDNRTLERYRMSAEEILDAAREGAQAGLKTIVLQSGEDPFYTGEMLAGLIVRLKEEHGVAVTVSVGDRKKADYRLMRKAGADRYLLKHETADPELFTKLRPGTTLEGRIRRLVWLKELGYQVGSGNMVGLPGQTIESIADDILLLRELDVEMAGIGPFIPHYGTPLAGCTTGDVGMTLKVLAVARIALPFTHLPATTALGSIHPEGRQLALARGANVVMPDITPVRYKKLYEIYPNKICITEEGPIQCVPCISGIILQSGRSIATDYGHSRKPAPYGSSGREGTIKRG